MSNSVSFQYLHLMRNHPSSLQYSLCSHSFKNQSLPIIRRPIVVNRLPFHSFPFTSFQTILPTVETQTSAQARCEDTPRASTHGTGIFNHQHSLHAGRYYLRGNDQELISFHDAGCDIEGAGLPDKPIQHLSRRNSRIQHEDIAGDSCDNTGLSEPCCSILAHGMPLRDRNRAH